MRQRRTIKEGRKLVERFRSGTQSRGAFCESESIHISTLKYWEVRVDSSGSVPRFRDVAAAVQPQACAYQASRLAPRNSRFRLVLDIFGWSLRICENPQTQAFVTGGQ